MIASRRGAAIPFLLVILISAAYLTTSFSVTQGRAVAPLDDAYIAFQYARQTARGHPYEYNTGDPQTTGMTSPLYAFLLSGAYLAGLHNENLIERFLAGSRWFVPPGVLLLSTLGWIVLAIRQQWMRLSTTLSWFLVGTLSTATLITAMWHVGRYQVPFTPIVIILATCGLAFLWQRARRNWHRIGLWTLACYVLITSGYSSLHHLRRYRLSVLTMARQQLTIADWLRENLPPGARVGVHDTGSLRYVGRRPTYDVIGLTTRGAATAWRHGAGSVFEKMEHSPMRPSCFAIYPDVLSIPYLAETDIFSEELFRVEVPNYAVASAGPIQGVWRADWNLAGSGEERWQSDILRRTRGL